jgi:hypothetical protein
MRREADEGHWVWVDDRFASGFYGCGESPIVSALEILEDLREKSLVNERVYFGYRPRLRAVDFRNIPTIARELPLLPKADIGLSATCAPHY